ncbi:hypothetical protein DNTS_003719 [Danionella cerebrum]|uniref:Uncharacterized protein n=1 Tax=Danionella cerebrum TaxID=2873325 RepID=A0A553RDK0_9TELE|nr:hypothetical protein DNTS_003719 [Danionella translucida]
MGRRAADHPTPVPVLGEPALVGTRVWRTMPFGTSSMAAMTLVHHCNVGVQTSPKMRNQLQLDGKHTNEENITMQATKDPDINVDHRKEQTKSIIIKQRSLETKMKKGVTFEGLEKDFYKNIKNEKQHNNCSSLTLSAMANYMPKQKKSCFFTNGSVVDPEVMGGISSDISEGEEFSKGKKIPLPPRSPPERPPVMICSTCGGKQYPASAEIDNKTKKMAVSASAYSLGLQLRDSSPLYPGKDIQIESHNARSVTQSDLHPMSPNLHPYLSMNTNKEWPLSRLPAQQSEVSNLTNHHAVKRESSVDTNINQSSRSSALNAQTLTIPEKEDRGSFLNTHKAENSCPCIPPQIDRAETILSDPSSRKHDHPVSALQLLPASPYFGNRRDSKNKLEMVEASLQSNKDRVTTLLNIIQDLEMNHALSKGVEYEFRQQEGRFKELLHSLCPHTMERTEEYEESLLTSLIQNHKLHRLKANLMSQVKPENQAQTVCKNQCQIQTPNQNSVTKSQNQTRSETKIQSHSQIQLQPQTSFSSQSEILSQILPPFPIMSQIQPQNQAQTHSQNQCLFKAKIKRKKLCRKLFGWLPHRVYLK